VVTHQLQVERRTAKARRPKTDVLPLDHSTNVTYLPTPWAVCVPAASNSHLIHTNCSLTVYEYRGWFQRYLGPAACPIFITWVHYFITLQPKTITYNMQRQPLIFLKGNASKGFWAEWQSRNLTIFILSRIVLKYVENHGRNSSILAVLTSICCDEIQ